MTKFLKNTASADLGLLMFSYVLFGLSFLISTLCFSFLYIPVSFSFILYAVFFFFKERLLVSYSINFSSLLVLFILYLFSEGISLNQFSSPHQKLIADPSFNFFNYPENRKILNQVIQIGDLNLLDDLPSEYSSDREVNFITDNLGFRNTRNFKNGDIVLVGDSYIVGNGGVDQIDTISAKLEKYTGIGFYNLGFPGDPHNYYHRLVKYEELIEKSNGLILFIFEGNDLNCQESTDKSLSNSESTKNFLLKILNYRIDFFENTLLYKFGFGLYHRSYGLLFDSENKTYRGVVNGRETAFLKDYVDHLYDSTICPKRLQEFSAIYDRFNEHIKTVVYIPSKGRIYFESIGNARPKDTKAEIMRDQAKNYEIEFIDLSTYFQAHKGENLLYFTDDTHWNAFGIDLAARIIFERLNKL